MNPNSKSNQVEDPQELRAQLPRRRMLGGLAVAGVATTLIAACDDNSGGGSPGGGGDLNTDSKVKGATEATKAANKKVLDTLPFNDRSDRSDFEDAKRGLLERPET